MRRFATELPGSAGVKPSPMLIFSVLASAVVTCWAADFCLRHSLAWRCPAQVLLGIPCPSCGSTRALAALSRFELLNALGFNPLITVALPLAAALGWFYRSRPVPARLWMVLVGFVILNWFYL